MAAFDRVMESAGVQSWLERQFLQLIERAGLPRPTLQRTYRHDGRHVARVDFDFEPWPVLVEVGGRRGYLAPTSAAGRSTGATSSSSSARSSTSSPPRT